MPDQPAQLSLSPYQLETAKLNWRDGDIPEARDYDDIYFSNQQGLEESRYVFLQHNQLEPRWQQLQADQHFTIGETGFGTGLNFLAAWHLWRQTAPPEAQLHFISTEKHPLTLQDLERSLKAWPELDSLAQELIKRYPVLTPGTHLIHFDNNKVSLQLLLGEAKESLEQLRCSPHSLLQDRSPYTIDAWFLDGFAPAKNPDLWNDELYSLMADLSGSQTTLATFTAVGEVRRGLNRQGFSIKKTKGYGRKREMLYGQFTNEGREVSAKPSKRKRYINAPWYTPQPTTGDSCKSKRIAIIGGGLAGTTCARAMASRGWHVSLIERADQLAQGASGNPQGMLYTKLSPEANPLNQFTLSSYLYALRFYRQWQHDQNISHQHLDFCGVLQLARNDKELQQFEQLRQVFLTHPNLVRFLNPAEASQIAGINVDTPGWFFPAAGWLSPGHLCHSLVENANIEVCYNRHALRLDREQQQWIVGFSDEQTSISADAVIIANSRDALAFQQSRDLPIKTIRGQITLLESSSTSRSLKTVVCHEGYITPAINDSHSLGATFDNGDCGTDLRTEDHRRNLHSLHSAIPSLLEKRYANIELNTLSGRASLRCTSPDYLPMVGPVPQHQQFLENYARLRKDAYSNINTPGSYYPNLYLNIAHGSRGLTSTPLCSQLIAAMICREPLPLARDLVTALNPARFVIRNLIRNKI